VLPEDLEAVDWLGSLLPAVAGRRDATRNLVNESFDVHAAASIDLLGRPTSYMPWDQSLSPGICRNRQVVWRNWQVPRPRGWLGSSPVEF
jgi:hypothetical protein